MLKQLSIYAENRKGTFKHVTGILEEENINNPSSVQALQVLYQVLLPEEWFSEIHPKTDTHHCQLLVL